jgi:hypothetical protein
MDYVKIAGRIMFRGVGGVLNEQTAIGQLKVISRRQYERD